MSSTVTGSDIIRIRIDCFLIIIGTVLQSNTHSYTVFFSFKVNGFTNTLFFLGEIIDILFNSVFIAEFSMLTTSFIMKSEFYSAEKISTFLDVVRNNIVFKINTRKDSCVRFKSDHWTTLLGVTKNLEWSLKFSTIFETNMIDFSIPKNSHITVVRKGICNRASNTM